MKKMYLMKGMAVLALGLVVASCNKMDFDQDAYQKAKEAESRQKFINNVMGGQEIDPNQTWSTTVANKVTVNSELSGTLRIYTANPHGTKAASLLTQDIKAGSYDFTVTKPQDAENLYAKLTLDDGTIRVSEITNNAVTFKAPGAATRSARRVVKNDVAFPDAPASYPTTCPNNDADHYFAGNYKYFNGGSFWMDENTSKHVDIQGECDMYLVKNNGDGIITPNDYWYVGAAYGKNIRLFICPGVTLDISINKNIQDGVEIYIAPGATLKCSDELVLNATAKVYVAAGATLDVPSISINADNYGERVALLYNQSTINFSGNIRIHNGMSTIVNEGTINAANITLEGSSKFWNKAGTVNITNAAKTSGTTTVNSNNAVWINDGQYNTVNYDYTAGSVNVWNNCKLTVYNKFYINLGQNSTSAFKMDGGSSAIIKEFVMDANSRVIMGGNSIIKVTEKTVMNNTAQSFEDAGIIGPQSGDLYAVLQSPVIEKGSDNNSKYVCYNGNVYIATDSHFAQKDEETNNPMYRIKGNASIANGQTAAPYTIPANGKCSDGYNGGGGGGDDSVEYYYYAFEDLGAIGDFDFNDVVLRVSSPVNNVCTVDLMAAGGTLKTKVVYGDQTLCDEVHEAFEVELGGGNFDMVNTGYTKRDFVSLGTVTIAEGADMANLPFGIVVTGNNGESVKVTREVDHKGTAPLMIVVNGYPEGDDAGKWFWAKERVNISVAYPDFGAWGADVQTNQNWYQNYVDGSVWKY